MREYSICLDVLVYGYDVSGQPNIVRVPGVTFGVTDSTSRRGPVWAESAGYVTLETGAAILINCPENFKPEFYVVEHNESTIGSGEIALSDKNILVARPTVVSVKKATFEVMRMSA